MKTTKTLLAMHLLLSSGATIFCAEEATTKEVDTALYDATVDAYTGSVTTTGLWTLQHLGEPYSGKTVGIKPDEGALERWTTVAQALPDATAAARFVEVFSTQDAPLVLPQEVFTKPLELIQAEHEKALAEAAAAYDAYQREETEIYTKVAPIQKSLLAAHKAATGTTLRLKDRGVRDRKEFRSVVGVVLAAQKKKDASAE